MYEIYVDESGNSGPNLIRPTEPVLVLASIRVPPTEIEFAEQLFKGIKSLEWKFVKFRKHHWQIELLLQFLRRDWFNRSMVKGYVVHKGFLVISKLVDVIHEPSARQFGVNLYEKGAALCLANLLATCLPVFLPADVYQAFLRSFVDLIRSRSESELRGFKLCATSVWSHLRSIGNEDLAGFLAPVVLACEEPDSWLPFLSADELDPLSFSYFTICDAWGEELVAPFALVSDNSKILESSREFLKIVSDPSLRPIDVPRVAGSTRFPLRISEVRAVDSLSSRQVQIADLIAGLMASVFGALSKSTPLQPWQQAARELFCDRGPFAGALWPSPDVTPEGVDAAHVVGESAPNYMFRILTGDPLTRLD